MAAASHFDKQRLAFGNVASLYDQVRPSYPDEAIDAMVRFARLRAPARVLEVGAGTGKATVLLAERGLRVLALEPSREMAEVARANCAAYPGVEIVETDFEQWSGCDRVPALVSAAAWHWIAPDVRYAKAHEVLLPGGTLAAMWTFPEWERCGLRPTLSKAYQAAAPALEPDFPMHPDSQPTALAGDWMAETAGSKRFEDSQTKTFRWTGVYSAAEYAMLLQTHQDHILLKPDPRAELLAAVTAAIDAHGGHLTLPLATHVCLARSC